MTSPRPGFFVRPWVRLACALAATAVLGLTVWAVGARAVLDGVGTSIHIVPLLAGLEAVMLTCSTFALRALYGDSGPRIPARQWVRAGTAGYALGLVLPMGRSAGEALRAVLLGRNVGGPRAAVAAVQMQGVTLLSNGLFLVPVTVAALALIGPGITAALIFANGLLAAGLGTGILVLRQRAHPGRLLGRLVERLKRFGMAFDAATGASRSDVIRSLAWECLGRCAQAVQCGVALAALGQSTALGRVLVTLGLHMVGSALGDLLPAQLGATEATLVVGAGALALTAATAASLALLIHGAQMALGLLCAAVAVGLPSEPGPAQAEAEFSP